MISLFNRSNSTELRNSHIMHWEQRLYSWMFPASSGETTLERPIKHFGVLLTEQESKLNTGSSEIEHSYNGVIRAELDSNEFCDVRINLSFHQRGGDFPIEGTPFGYASFEQVMTTSKPGHAPAIFLLVRDINNLSQNVSSLFAGVKAAGGSGVDVLFSINVKNLLGLDAKAAWGSWGRANSHLPGRQPFPFDRVEFSTHIK